MLLHKNSNNNHNGGNSNHRTAGDSLHPELEPDSAWYTVLKWISPLSPSSVPLLPSLHTEGSWRLPQVKNFSKVTHQSVRRSNSWGLLCPTHGVQTQTVLPSYAALIMGREHSGSSPNSDPPPGAHLGPTFPSLCHPTAMWANTLPLPRQGTPDLHNLIKFCILVFRGAGLWRMLSAWS